MRYSRAYLAHLHHRPVPDEPEPEPMVKSCSLLTSQPCECTLTAVGPVKVLVLHGARQRLADYRAEEAANVLPPVVNMNTYFNFNFNAPAHLHHWHMRASDAGWSCFKPVLAANTLKVPVQDDAQTGWEQSVDPACDAPVQLRKRRPPLAPMVQYVTSLNPRSGRGGVPGHASCSHC